MGVFNPHNYENYYIQSDIESTSTAACRQDYLCCSTVAVYVRNDAERLIPLNTYPAHITFTVLVEFAGLRSEILHLSYATKHYNTISYQALLQPNTVRYRT